MKGVEPKTLEFYVCEVCAGVYIYPGPEKTIFDRVISHLKLKFRDDIFVFDEDVLSSRKYLSVKINVYVRKIYMCLDYENQCNDHDTVKYTIEEIEKMFPEDAKIDILI